VWESPVYKLKSAAGKYVQIDVTTSCAANLGPNKVIIPLIAFFKAKGVNSILDFGAGALRHTIPLLAAGFDVWAVEFERQFQSPACRAARALVQNHANFTSLIFPYDFLKCKEHFDAALLAFVLPTMPRKKERTKLLSVLKKKLKEPSYIFWMSQYGKYGDILTDENRVADGWYLHPKRRLHSFYTEFKNAEIDKMIKRIGFDRIRVLGTSGHDQFRLYSRGGSYP
jgi:hypothetical protein